MANFFSKAKIKTATQTGKTRFDLSCSHMTTSDFYMAQPVYIAEMMPGEKRKVSVQTFTRLSPLVEPFFGECRVVNRSFFVPMRVIMPEWNAFITDTPTVLAGSSSPVIPPSVPQVSNDQLCEALMYDSRYVTKLDSSASFFDIYGYDDTGFPAKYNFTIDGKILYKLLISLGYKLNFTSHSGAPDADQTLFSALPLFAYCKIHFDWLKNPAYNTHDEIESIWKSNPFGKITTSAVTKLLAACKTICYRADYFTSAWDNPVSPNSSSSMSAINIPDLENDVLSATQRRTNVAFDPSQRGFGLDSPNIVNGQFSQGSALQRVTDYMLKAVHKVTDYVTRKRLVGNRDLDRYMAQFGVQLDSAKLNRSIELGHENVPISISDVMQTSNDVIEGDSANGLGDYAGKGVGYQGFGSPLVDFSTDEFGYLFIISYIEPKVSYLHGRPRMLQHINRFDFFTADFDSLGTQAIRLDELSANLRNGGSLIGKPQNIFGFINRYAEYKKSDDNLSGDFLLGSKKTSLDGWILQRDLSQDTIESASEVRHDLAFTEADCTPFENIFVLRNINSDQFFDHFFLKYDFKVESFMPCKPLFDWYDFDSEGKNLEMSINGTQVTD